MTLKIFEGFSGYGGASFGLIKAGIDFEVVGYSEIDKGAIKCFEQNFPNIKNYGDIKNINPDDLPDFDLFTGGFPCQDVSIAGNRDLSKGRTNLYQEILRTVSVKKPKFLLLENVKGLLSIEVNERNLINVIVSDLQRIGYGVCWKVLNSKDYGVPQNRERVWFVCKLGGWEFNEFQFPNKEELKIRWRNLEDNPINFIKVKKTPSRDIMRKRCKNITKEKVTSTISLKQDRFPNSGIIDFEDYYRFLTPTECFRLMGFFKDEINLDGLTIAQKYKLAGNGWDINLVSKIFKRLKPLLEIEVKGGEK